MLFDIEQKSDIPLYEQLVDQVIFAVASGALPPGEILPGVRELGPKLLVHPNTVAKAWQELEKDGILASRRGKGMEVTSEAPDLCRQRRQNTVRKRIRDALRQAVASALPPEEVRRLVEEELARVNGKAHRD
jgi:GntR family transcriptional regulator